MNKTELIETIAGHSGLTKADSSRAIEAFISTVSHALGKQEEVSITGFGVFSVSERSGRQGRNPQTGATIEIAASKVPKFKAGKGLKDAAQGKK